MTVFDKFPFTGSLEDHSEDKSLYSEHGLLMMGASVQELVNIINDVFVVNELKEPELIPGKFLYVNDFVCSLLGYTREELLSKTPMDIMDSKDINGLSSLERSIIDKEKTVLRTFLIRKNGEKVPVEISSSFFIDSGKRYIVSLARNTTEKMQANRLLKESEQKYRRLVENLFEVIYSLKPDGTITFISNGVKNIFGFSPIEMTGRNFVEFIYPEDIPRLNESFRMRLKNDSEPEQFQDIRIMDKNGDIRYINISSKKYKEKGELAGVMGTITDITARKKMEKELQASYLKLEKSMEDTITAVSRLIEIRDPYTAGHQRRVFALANAIAADMGMPHEQQKGLGVASLVHDIGKISVPSEILTKPGTLTDTEFRIIKEHPETGYLILKDIEFACPVDEIVRQHHERLDGSGYPRALKEDEILIEAKIIAVADTVEAMSSHRPYRPSLGIPKALEFISGKKDILFDASVVESCLSLFRSKGFSWGDQD